MTFSLIFLANERILSLFVNFSNKKWRFTEKQWNMVLKTKPWRKYRIGIHSEPIRTIPILSDICIQANANYSEPIRKTFCISFDKKR